MTSRVRTILLAACLCVSTAARSFQQFDPAVYRQFLTTHQNMTPEQLLRFRPAGAFLKTAPTPFSTALYSDSIQAKYPLTAYERSLIERNGFVVTERIAPQSFGAAFDEIWHKDLPVFISTDAILHAIHMSYDAMLKSTEEQILIERLDTLLTRVHRRLPTLASAYAGTSGMTQPLRDVDLYCTIPLRLLRGNAVATAFPETSPAADALMKLIASEQPHSYALFSSVPRTIDFSQFKVRGHYTQSPALGRYFQSMIWLGRTELYLIAPVNSIPPQTNADIQRQAVDAVLVSEAVKGASADSVLEEIDGMIRFFAGESDNVTLRNLRTLIDAVHLSNAADLLDSARWAAFQETLKKQSFADQRILSQIIISDPSDPDQIRPASAFLLLGQRFVIDSYVTGSVVFDKILFENRKIWRPLPSNLDVLFTLGNDAAAQLLGPELSKYHYATNLASLRYLVDAYEQEFWESTLYNNWLHSIRALSPPADRSMLPAFMRTAAWWQEKMNTQLASWAQLRHDNLLYAKQSYTGGTICSFPEGYVEPIPEFYARIRQFASIAASRFKTGFAARLGFDSYWEHVRDVADTLGSIAQKELSKTPLTDDEKGFLRRMLFVYQICGGGYSGWYYRMFYTGAEGFRRDDRIVADIHTCPTDEAGNMVGWVMHAGTGPVNMAVVTTELPDNRLVSFIGPVMSYYEHVSVNFKRLSDEEWKTAYAMAPTFRPDFVNLYLADQEGKARAQGPSLLTGVDDPGGEVLVPASIVLGRNYPNPFNGTTIITFTIPDRFTSAYIDLSVYDVQGRKVRTLVNRTMPSGKFAVSWDGSNEHGMPVSSGIYFYHLSTGGTRLIGKMTLVR
ncbi:MAG: DUF3160 domain-containing protein [Acidobacteriota bacterium]